MSQSMMAEGSGVSPEPSDARGVGLVPSGAATRPGAAATGDGGRGMVAGGLISRGPALSRATELSRIGVLSRGTTTRALDVVARGGVAACASIGAALTGARRSGSAARSASPDGPGLDGASAGGRVTTAGAGGPSSRAGACGRREAPSEAVRAEWSPRPVSHHAR